MNWILMSIVSFCFLANIDETTNCPLNVNHVCQFCAEDQTRYGCYCESPNGDSIVTASIFTPCPSGKLKTNKIRKNLCMSLDVVDPCSSTPCLNGGTCVREGLSSYKCTCASGFGGDTCNITLPSKIIN